MQDYYNYKSVHYGIGHTRLRRILGLAKNSLKGKVLDVGCARGYLGRRIKEIGGNYVAGIEISEGAAHQARAVLDDVYVFDIQKHWLAEVKEQKFDLIILSEVLEHVFDPVFVLKNAHDMLSPDGEIIITTPNFMVWTNRIKFLFGNFKYQEQGMFDFGHIRWFTYRYLQDVLQESGFKVIQENHIIFPGKLTKFLKFWPSLFAFQFILKARKI